MTQSLNQFKMTPEQGQLDLTTFGQVETMQVDAAQATPLIPGQPIKIVDSAGGLPKVVALAANTDVTDGFVNYNVRKPSFAAGDAVEISRLGAVMWMTAGGAIARDGEIEVVYTTTKVIAAAGTNPKVGKAYDKAAADGDLIRVYIMTPYIKQP